MDAARVTAIAEGITVKARTSTEGGAAAGAWRDVEEGGVVHHREELLVESDGAKFGFAACRLQKRIAGVWADAVIVTLDVAEGSSHFRKDRLSIGGNELASSVSLFTIEKGEADLRTGLWQLKRQAKSRFTLEGSTLRFRGLAAEIEHGSRAEVGGFEQNFSGAIVADREQFQGLAVVPARTLKLTWANGRTYRITSVREDEISYTIEVASVNA